MDLKTKQQKEESQEKIKEIVKYKSAFTFKDFLAGLFLFSIILAAANIYAYKDNPAVMIVSMVFGFLIFLPLGIFVGWLVLDPYQRAKVLRFLTKRNYGIVNIVSRGKEIKSIIKNFDEDVIKIGEAVWVIEPNKIYRLDKSDNVVVIDPKTIHYIGGVPTLFISLDNARPLSFFEEPSKIKPEELGATLSGWVYNQMAKALFFKRTMEIIFIGLIILIIISIYFGYNAYNEIQQLKEMVKNLPTQTITNATLEIKG